MQVPSGHKYAYQIDWAEGLAGARNQAVSSADRPLCALVSAAASLFANRPLLGTARGLDTFKACAVLGKDICSFLPPQRWQRWARVEAPLHIGHTPISSALVEGFSLDTYQLSAIAGAKMGGVVYSLDCGLGKTVTAVATALLARNTMMTFAAAPNNPRCWILCPLNAMGAWKRFVPILEREFSDVRVLSMDSAHKYTALDDRGGVVIYDEVHLLGEGSARRTKAAHEIRTRFDYGICLTGTLLHGGVEKALSILDLAIPGSALFASRWSAGEHFHCLVKKNIGARTVTALEKPTGANREAFIRYLSRVVVAMKKDHPEVRAAFQLPEQHIVEVKLGEPWEDLDTLSVRLAREKLAETGEIPHMQAIAHLAARAGAAEKVEWVMNELADDSQQVVIFANYLETLDLMQKALEDAGITFVRVDGSVTGETRIDCQKQFQAGTVRVFLGQETAASTSMDLFNGRASVCLDHSWKGTDYAQMLARTCRRGQTHETVHLDLVCNRFQQMVVGRVRAAQDFDASVAEWQRMKDSLDWEREINSPSPSPSVSESP